MKIKSDYCITALYPSGSEFIVYDELTYDEAQQLQIDLNDSKEEDIMYLISDGNGTIPYLDKKK